MAETQARYRSKRASTPRSPINFRMPTALRARLRRFAEERGLGESDALRLVVSERLDEVESDRELQAAERWQFKQAYKTFQRILRGEEKYVEPREIEQSFDRALSRVRSARGRRK